VSDGIIRSAFAMALFDVSASPGIIAHPA